LVRDLLLIEHLRPQTTGCSVSIKPGQLQTIEEFLDAMTDYARDARLPEEPSWALFARLLLAGKGYE